MKMCVGHVLKLARGTEKEEENVTWLTSRDKYRTTSERVECSAPFEQQIISLMHLRNRLFNLLLYKLTRPLFVSKKMEKALVRIFIGHKNKIESRKGRVQSINLSFSLSAILFYNIVLRTTHLIL